MSKKSKLSFSIKKSLIVGAVGATAAVSTLGCTVNPAPEPIEMNYPDAGDAGDADDADTGEDAGNGENADEDSDKETASEGEDR